MDSTVSQMSPEELRVLIEEIVKKAVREEFEALLNGVDDESEVQPEVILQLKEQADRVRKGERGRCFKKILAA